MIHLTHPVEKNKKHGRDTLEDDSNIHWDCDSNYRKCEKMWNFDVDFGQYSFSSFRFVFDEFSDEVVEYDGDKDIDGERYGVEDTPLCR